MYECTNGNCEKYIFANGTRIAKVTVASGTTNYYHGDHLGGSSIITDNAGNQVEQTAYYPYGATRTDAGTVNVKHKFTGQEYDAETGLYFYGARYYDPVLGRFISPDTIVQSPGNPQTLNRYSYCLNNPLKYTDPSGHFWWLFANEIIQSIVASIEIAAMKYAVDSYNHNQDPKHYPAPSGFSIGMTFYNTGEMSIDTNGIPGMLFGRSNNSPFGMFLTQAENLNGVAKPDLETTITGILILIRFPEAGVVGKGLATKGGEILDAAAELGNTYGIIAKNEGKIAGAGISSSKSSVSELLMKDGKLIGTLGNGPDVKTLSGGQQAAEQLFKDLTVNGKVIQKEGYSGTMVQTSEGTIGYRISEKWGPTIDVNTKLTGSVRFHFKE